MREIVLDTETTGLEVKHGHRIIEIGGVELKNHIPTGATYHTRINPKRAIDKDASQVHGMGDADVAKAPVFAEIADKFLTFVGDATLVIHNAPFDMGFLNAELAMMKYPPIPHDRVIDTLILARRKFPGAPANLDALCKRFEIDTSARTSHGALIDAELLARVYIELIGGKQQNLMLQKEVTRTTARQQKTTSRPPRDFPPSEAEKAAHAEFISTIKNPLWDK